MAGPISEKKTKHDFHGKKSPKPSWPLSKIY